ncbi:hypothetical protein FB567DRAFT_619366 [Paraphoma chrysanthemicola]|uniref:Cytidyltransferase-like domain-containing protein n=1 Tax=Paraphoma chrysanthemicola TaxID=798071 RepID=A0A8K0RAZ3_9PLEO|nr:hypothetical protein FB567DRAFT_619366 [Paraphoma chrysanthemicola]
MSNSTAEKVPLEPYIARAFGCPQAQIFDRSELIQGPILVKGQTNRILTYRGCFNPPHQGHKDTLCHGFFRGGDDLNIIAAIIFFAPDASVRAKYAVGDNCSPNYVLTQKQHIDLFNQSGLYGGWHWCYPENIRSKHGFKKKLRDEAAKDGFEIRFVCLTGADHVGTVGSDRYHRGNTIVVGTGHRERTIFRADTESGFTRLPNYKEWQKLPLTEELIDRFGAGSSLAWLEQKLEMLSPDAVHDLPNDPNHRSQAVTMRLSAAIWHLGELRHCEHSTGPSHQWIRFVPTRLIGMEGGAWFLGYPEKQFSKQISSTRIRVIMAEVDEKVAMVKALPGVALRPELLFDYTQDQKRVEH